MGKLITTAFVSLDGVMEAPGGEPGYRNNGWTFQDIEFLPEVKVVEAQTYANGVQKLVYDVIR